jgi:hypothetical protein
MKDCHGRSYDFVLIATSMEKLKSKILRWKMTVEAKGLEVNIGKTKVTLSCDGPGQGTCQNQINGFAVFVEQGWDLTQRNVLVQNGCTKMR